MECQVSRITVRKAVDDLVEVRQILGLQDKKPQLKIHATSYCLHENQEKPFEVYESYILTDILSYSIEKYNV